MWWPAPVGAMRDPSIRSAQPAPPRGAGVAPWTDARPTPPRHRGCGCRAHRCLWHRHRGPADHRHLGHPVVLVVGYEHGRVERSAGHGRAVAGKHDVEPRHDDVAEAETGGDQQ